MEDRFQSSNFIGNELLFMPAESQINPNARVVLSYELKNWEYMAAEVYIDDNGELKLRDNGGMIQIGPITLLYQVDFDDNNNVINSNPLEAANVYLMYQKIRNDAKCVSLAYRALKHYFSFIADENTTRRQNGQPELLWNEMPIRKSERATYRYKRCLEDCYKSKDPNIHLAWSTSNAYINRVVDFYSHYIKRGWDFKEKPFEYVLVYVSVPSKYSSMNGQRRMEVHTTDLRLNLGKNMCERPSPLTALAPYQWAAL